MIFESLSDRLQATFKKLRGHGKLTEDDVNEAMRDVRMALLEADVNFKVVKQFIKTVKERAIGQDVLETLTPAQVVIKIVDEELTKLMGGTQSRINMSPKPPTIIMMVGLQARRRPPASSVSPSRSRASVRCSSPLIFTVRPLSRSCRSSANSSISPFSRWSRARTP